jgi:uncharacterized protein YecE (DUF72 family)
MPTLNWLTKPADLKTADKTSYRLLEEVSTYSYGDTNTENKLVQGDNLEALKTLLPFYAGKGYMRFHGRNRKNWYGTYSKARYDYLYSDEDLFGYKKPIEEMAAKSKVLQVFFNNHAKGAAPTNAKRLQGLLIE